MKVFFFLVTRLFLALSLLLTISLPINAQETAKTIYDQIIAIDKKNDASGVSGGFASIIFFNQTYEREMQLKKMALGGNADAAFYWGLYNFNRGVEFHATARRQTDPKQIAFFQSAADDHFADAMTGLRISSKAGYGDSSYNIAQMYQNGLGVSQTKLAAAEWYAKAGAQYLRQGLREVSLSALERAEAIDPKIPDVVALRAQLFPQIKK